MKLVPGDQFGPYKVLAEVGQGGQAVVYRAEHEAMERVVALKVYDSTRLQGQTALERFKREAIAAARVEHPRIVTIHDAGEVDGSPYIVMRYVDGPSLEEMVHREGALDPGRAIEILTDVAEALDFLNSSGLVHRDMKSANVLIDRDGTAYLSDFGLAHLDDRPALTRRGEWMGTAEYLSPEQVEGKGATSASDRYAFACVAFEALTGRPPFVHAEPSAILLAHARDTAPAPSSIRPELPAELDEVMERALDKDPEGRPSSARGMVEEIRLALLAPGRRMTVMGAAALPLAPHDPWNSVLARFSQVGEVPEELSTREIPPAPPAAPKRRFGIVPRSAGKESAPAPREGAPWLAPPPGDADGEKAPDRRRGLLIGGAIAAGVLVIAGVAVGSWFLGNSQAASASTARTEGYAAGKTAGFSEGREQGFSAGRSQGIAQGTGRGRTVGMRIGRTQGYRLGMRQGKKDGYRRGYGVGYSEGESSGIEQGRSQGRSEALGSLSGGGLWLVQTGSDSNGTYVASASSLSSSPTSCIELRGGTDWIWYNYCVDSLYP